MKDPLQIEEIPYEILGIPVTADNKAIDLAFKKSIAAKCDVGKMQEARNTLRRPLERAFVDIFLYHGPHVNQLIPHIGDDGSSLVERRMDIAKSWSNIQKKLFPHHASIHSLALLWYWWARYSEKEQLALLTKTPFEKKANLPATPPLDKLWLNTISGWVFIIKSDDFLSQWIKSREQLGIQANISAEALCQKLEEHFSNLFHTLREKYRNNGDKAATKRYRDYELFFSAEMDCADKLRNNKPQLQIWKSEKKHFICCGRLMLDQVGLLETIMTQLEGAPGGEPLLDILSPYFYIGVLIENHKFDEAIRSIEALPQDIQKEKRLCRFQTKAYLEKGKQHFSLSQYEEALECWRKGFATGELREKILEAVVTQCRTKAISLKANDPDTATKLLEMALNIVRGSVYSGVTLKETLSVIYCDRGISRIIKAQDRQKNVRSASASLRSTREIAREYIDEMSDIESEIKKGVEELRKAVKLDSSNVRALEQLRIAEGILADLGLEDVYGDMKAERWGEAIDKIEAFLKREPENARAYELLENCNEHMCFFCKGKKNNPDKSAEVEVKMHKVTERTSYQIKWNTLTLTVPRCMECKKAHAKNDTYTWIGSIGGGILGLILSSVFGLWFLCMVGFGAAGFGIGNWIGKNETRKKTKDNGEWTSSPLVKLAQAEGWVLGEKPPEARQ